MHFQKSSKKGVFFMSKKRQNGEGTIYQTKTGLWRCEITLGYDENKKRIKKTISSRSLEELHKKINDLKYLNDRKLLAEPQNALIGEWLDFWLETYKRPSVKPTTYDMYHNAVNTYLKPTFGHYKLDKLNTITIQKFINDISQNGKNGTPLSQSSIKKILLTLSQAYEQAVKLNMIYQNPCNQITLPKTEKRKAVAFTEDEQKRFLSHCTLDTTFNCLFIFAFNTGMRMGELFAITWDDINFDNKSIKVNKNLTVVGNYDENAAAKTKTIISTTKTESGEREIPLTKQALDVIEAQKERNKQNSVFVFYSTNNTPLMKRNVYRAFNKILEISNITSPVTFHSIRHSFATRLLERGADIKTVSTLLGHQSIQITLDIYSHVSNDLKRNTISLLE